MSQVRILLGAPHKYLIIGDFHIDQKAFTLSLGLRFDQSQHGGTEWNMLMAASTLVVLPIIALFFFTQKTFIQGVTMTGLKG